MCHITCFFLFIFFRSSLGRSKEETVKLKMTKKEMMQIFTDNLKRSVDLKSKLYQCKILKKCKKIYCVGKNKSKCSGMNEKNKMGSKSKPRKQIRKVKFKQKKKIKSSMLWRKSSVLDSLKSL